MSAWYVSHENGEVEIDLEGRTWFEPQEAIRLATAIQNAAQEAARED